MYRASLIRRVCKRSCPRLGPPMAWVLVYSLCAAASVACQIPVFRYALERWSGDAYAVVVEHSERMTTEQVELIEFLRRGEGSTDTPANLEVQIVKADGAVSSPTPNVTVHYPALSRVDKKEICRLPLTRQTVAAIRTSPAREKLAHRLLEGDSAVYVFLPSGDPGKDKLRRDQLAKHLRAIEPRLKLPQGMENDPERRLDTSVEIKLSFSIVEVDRTEPAEAVFVAMLLGSEPDLHSFKEPMAFPVFGRGRLLYALIGAGINERTIADACGFLTGPCSCQVKSGNPGVDLLLSIDWQSAIRGSAAPAMPVVDFSVLPRLEDLGAVEAEVEMPNAESDGANAGVQNTSAPETAVSSVSHPDAWLPAATAPDRSPVWRIVFLSIALVVVTASILLLLGLVVGRRGASQ